MRIADALITGTVAVATMVGTLALLRPDIANAVQNGGPEPEAPAAIEAAGAKLVLTPVNVRLANDELPVAVLEARNPTDGKVTVKARVALTAVRPASPYSRMVVIPVERWSTELLVELAPGEVKRIDVRAGATLPQGNVGRFELAVGEQRVQSQTLALASDEARGEAQAAAAAPVEGDGPAAKPQG